MHSMRPLRCRQSCSGFDQNSAPSQGRSSRSSDSAANPAAAGEAAMRRHAFLRFILLYVEPTTYETVRGIFEKELSGADGFSKDFRPALWWTSAAGRSLRLPAPVPRVSWRGV